MAPGFALFDTVLGHCGLAWREDGALVGVKLPADAGEHATRAAMKRSFPALHESAMPPEIQSYADRIARQVAGQDQQDDMLDIPLVMDGVPHFQQLVYAAARAIAPGRTVTYGEMAAQIGEPGASRAVGQALGHNPFAPVVPCHRILAAGSGSGGFSAGGGVATKLRMLQAERARFGNEPELF